MLTLAKFGVFVSALWLLLAFAAMVIAPQRCLKFLSKMGSTPAIHFGEHILRGLAGLCLMGVSAHTPYPKAFLIVGGFLLATSILIGLAPRRWHHKYAVYWADRVSPLALRVMSVVPLGVGIYLVYVVMNA